MTDIAPGYGVDCKALFAPQIKLNDTHHFHCDATGLVRAYKGTYAECPEVRKARTAQLIKEGV
jgi:hypothetical protein